MTVNEEDYVNNVWTVKRIKEGNRSFIRSLKQNTTSITTKKVSGIFLKKKKGSNQASVYLNSETQLYWHGEWGEDNMENETTV